MGNSQSAVDVSQSHNRLSKPKTNTNSPALTSPVESPVSPSRYSHLSARERQHVKTDLFSPSEADFNHQRAVEQDGEKETPQRWPSNVSRSTTLSPFEALRESITKQDGCSSSKISLGSNVQSVDVETALRILQEVQKNASPEELAALRQALQPDATPTVSPSTLAEKPISRRSSFLNRSTSSLIRRGSLVLNPGVATRRSPGENRIRKWNSWKTPQVDPEEEAKWRVDMMGKSPLTKLAALDQTAEAQDISVARAHTPGEMEYSHLGSMKLGSLRIANGAPSPVPSARTPRPVSTPNIAEGVDYFSTKDGAESPIMMRASKGRRHARTQSAHPAARSLQQRLQPWDSALSPDLTPLSAETQSPNSEEKHADKHTMSNRQSLKQLQIVNKSADTLAKGYRADLPSSPFGIESEDGQGSLAQAEASREQALHILDGTMSSELDSTGMTFPRPLTLSTNSQLLDSFKCPQRMRERPSPRQTDSGYSSTGSFGTLGDSREEKSAFCILTESTIAHRLHSGEGQNTDSADVGIVAQNNFLHQQAEYSKRRSDIEMQQPSKSMQSPSICDRIEMEAISHTPTSRGSEEVSQDVDVSHTSSNDTTKLSVDSKTPAPKRLQKRRRSCQTLPAVQSSELGPTITVPTIPDDLRSKFVRRLSEAPDMGCLTRTYDSRDHIKDDKSVDVLAIQPLETVQSEDSTKWSRDHERSFTDLSPTPTSGVRPRLSFFRSKTMKSTDDDSDHDEQVATGAVDDFGTIASSIGTSPYDVALPALRNTATSPTHPHQLGRAFPQVKPMTNMNAQMASELARLRSHDLAQLGPKGPRRPKSFRERNFEAGEAIAYKKRPSSVYENIPPVPTVNLDGLSGHRKRHSENTPTATLVQAAAQDSLAVSQPNEVGSRAVSRTDLQGTVWESHARLWSQRRQIISEGLRQQDKVSQTVPPTSAVTVGKATQVLLDRYSGGLAFGYEGRDFGIGGSAGTRQAHSLASRKSMPFSTQYGVDLSDIPIFLQRA